MSVDDKYTYPGSGGVLVNLLGIRDATVLDQALNDYASFGWAEIQAEEPTDLGVEYLLAIHRQLFRDVLAWAGEIRDVDAQAVGVGIPTPGRSSSGLLSGSCSPSSPLRTTSPDSTGWSS